MLAGALPLDPSPAAQSKRSAKAQLFDLSAKADWAVGKRIEFFGRCDEKN